MASIEHSRVDRARLRSVRLCTWGYPVVWLAAGLIALAVGLTANATWAAGDDTGGLGAMLGAFVLAATLGNIAWAIGPTSRGVGVVCAVAAPSPSAWWATAVQPSASG